MSEELGFCTTCGEWIDLEGCRELNATSTRFRMIESKDRRAHAIVSGYWLEAALRKWGKSERKAVARTPAPPAVPEISILEVQAAPEAPLEQAPVESVEPVEPLETIEQKAERIKKAWINEEEEFLQAVQEARIFGFIASRSEKFYCFLSEHGRKNVVFAHKDDWRAKNGHHCGYNAGVKVSYRVELNPRLGKNKAVDVRLLEPPDIPDFEEATVFQWRNRSGFARRDCGCHVHIDFENVLSDVPTLRVGDRVWFSVDEASDANGRFRYAARNVEVFQRESEVGNTTKEN
jgi:cold shock CspA family protein